MTDTAAPAAHLRPVPDLDDDTETAAPVAVDNPALPEPKVSVEKRKPVLAGWLTDRRDFTATARHAGANAGYSALFHGVRLPVYAGRLALMSPRGACRFIATTNRWIWDREAAPLRAAAVRAEDVEEYMRLSRLRAGRVRLRGLVTLVAAVFGVGFALWLYVMAP
ncbi:cell division protein FtsK, partial [Streptomyces anulatus]